MFLDFELMFLCMYVYHSYETTKAQRNNECNFRVLKFVSHPFGRAELICLYLIRMLDLIFLSLVNERGCI